MTPEEYADLMATTDAFNRMWPKQIWYDRFEVADKWIAFIGYDPIATHPTQVKDNGGTADVWEFWDSARADRIGRGATPNDALGDLEDRWRAAGCPTSFQWDATETEA